MEIKFKDVAHLYMGCKIQTPEGIIGTIDELSPKSKKEQVAAYDMVCSYLSFGEFKPILRPLSDMTQDESNQITKCSAKIQQDGSGAMQAMGEAVRIALSLRLDLFGFIESEEATDATTLNPNPYN
jgi:hypothetical protein